MAAFFATLFGGLKRNGWFFKTLLNYTAPAVGFCLLIAVIQYAAGLTFAVAVECNGQSLGYIANEAVQHVKENNIVTPATVVMGTDESTEKVGEVIDTPDHIEIVTPDPEPTPDPTPDPEPTPDPTPDPEPEKNKDHTTVIIIMCVVIGVAVIAGIAVVVVLRKRKE